MKYSKEEVYKIFTDMVLGKEQVFISGRSFNLTYNFKNRATLEHVNLKESLPMLQIKDVKKFSDALYKYADTFMNSHRKYTKAENIDNDFGKEENKLMYALTNLFVNAGFEDFENTNQYINRRTDFLSCTMVKKHGEWKSAGEFPKTGGAKLYYRMAENHCALETPDSLEVKVERINEVGETETVHLPSISFGISDNTAYVFTSQMPKRAGEKDSPLLKKVERARYKVNEGIEIEEQNEEPFSIISATVLSAFLDSNGIDKIYANYFLPMRYYAKKEANQKKAGQNKEKLLELEDDQQRIQHNLTEKFLGAFFRVGQQTGKIEQFSNVEPGFTIFKIGEQSSQDNSENNGFLINIYDNVKYSQSQGLEH